MNAVKTFLLLGLLTALLVVAGDALGGRQGMLLAFGFAAAMNAAAYWWSDRIVLRMYRAREVGPAEAPELHQMLGELTRRAGLPTPRLALMPSETPNAFATGRNPRNAVVAVTAGLLRQLEPEEIRGVLAHELAHIKHRDILIASLAAVMAGAIAMLASMARFALIFGGHRGRQGGGNPFTMLLMLIVMPLAALLVQMAISRSREYHADAAAARFVGSPRPLIRALKRLEVAAQRIPLQAYPSTAHLFIVNPLRGGGLLALFSTHPPLQKRVERLEALTR
jgi:heat shock protein HtpX